MKATSKWRKAYYAKKLKEYQEYLGGKCLSCGGTDRLQFDHIKPKTKLFCITAKYDAKWEIVKPELDKCQLLCRSCHLDKSRNAGEVKQKMVHGLGMYRHKKCRCDICRRAWNEYHRKYKRKP